MTKVTSSQFSGRRTSNNAFVNGFPVKLFLVYLIVSPYLYTLTNGQAFYEDKKSDQNRPFYMGSRYGRSGQRATVQVTPRTDKFFLGSRYGKRASGLEMADATSFNNQNGDALRMSSEQDGDIRTDSNFVEDLAFHQHLNRGLKCTYLGIGNLYRCYNRDLNQMLSSL